MILIHPLLIREAKIRSKNREEQLEANELKSICSGEQFEAALSERVGQCSV